MMRVPLGVIGIIYESRPERDGGRRGTVPQGGQRDDPARRLGSDPQQSARSPRCIHEGLRAAGLPEDRRAGRSRRPTAPPSAI